VSKTTHKAWTPLRRIPVPPRMRRDADIPALGETEVGAYGFDEAWRNDQYEVFVRRYMSEAMGPTPVPMVHLSVKRLDQQPVRAWRHMQRIKNQVAGPDRYGFEILPRESQLVDAANQYHIWVVDDPDLALPIGWFGERMLGGAAAAAMVGAAQEDPEEVDGPMTITDAQIEQARVMRRRAVG
jgi:hypothetical protein